MNTDRLTYEVRQQDAGREVQYLLRERLRLPSGTIKLLKYNSGILLDGHAGPRNSAYRGGTADYGSAQLQARGFRNPARAARAGHPL